MHSFKTRSVPKVFKFAASLSDSLNLTVAATWKTIFIFSSSVFRFDSDKPRLDSVMSPEMQASLVKTSGVFSLRLLKI